MIELVAEIAMDCELGESPVWDDRSAKLWWTDIDRQLLHSWTWHDRMVQTVELPERLGSFGLTTDPLRLVAAFESGFALLAHGTAEVQWLGRPEATRRGIRFNDGRVDRQGRFWSGSMVEDPVAASGASGSLYRLDPDLSHSEHLTGVSIANSICFSPDGATLYFADSPSREIRAYSIEENGDLARGRLFSATQGPGVPDGSDVDVQGHVWNARWADAQIVRYDRFGQVVGRHPTPVTQPTSLTFGGPELRHLFVTTARSGLSVKELAAQPGAGSVLVYSAGTQGIPASRFAIRSDLS